MVLTALVVLLAASASNASARVYYLPHLPARVQLRAQGGAPFCGSGELLQRLRENFWMAELPSSLEYPDLTLTCAPADGDRIQFTVTDSKGAAVDDFKMKLVHENGSTDALAFLVGRRLATGKKTIRAALAAYQANSKFMDASGGVKAFDDGDWEGAASKLYRGLESGTPPSALFFGLYAAHAKLGHAAQARWYLMQYCVSEGKRPTKLDARQLSFLRGMAPSSAGAPPPGDLSAWRGLVAERRWSDAIDELKAILERAPWTVEAYDALADAYKAVGWTALQDNWRSRAKLARKAAGDESLHENLLEALRTP